MVYVFWSLSFGHCVVYPFCLWYMYFDPYLLAIVLSIPSVYGICILILIFWPLCCLSLLFMVYVFSHFFPCIYRSVHKYEHSLTLRAVISSIIGPWAKQWTGVPTYTITHRNKTVNVDKIKHIFIVLVLQTKSVFRHKTKTWSTQYTQVSIDPYVRRAPGNCLACPCVNTALLTLLLYFLCCRSVCDSVWPFWVEANLCRFLLFIPVL